MRRYAAIILTGFIVLAAADGIAGGGSIYSRYGIGDLRYTGVTQLLGVGGSGAAFQPRFSINDVNPAAWADVTLVRFSVSGLFEGFDATDGVSSVVLSKTTFNQFAMAIPIDRELGLTFGGGVGPISRVNYAVSTNEVQSGLVYTLKHEGSGGISRAFTGLSLKVTSQLQAAAAFNYYFGTNRYMMTQDFLVGPYADAQQTRLASLKGIGSTFGIIYRGLTGFLPLPFRHILQVGVSLTTTTYPVVTPEEVYVYGSVFSTVPPDTLSFPDTKIILPYTINGGFSYNTQGALIFADVRFQQWSKAPPGNNPGFSYRDGYRYSAGIEFGQDPNMESSMLKKNSYRAGIFHDRTPYVINGTPVNETGFSLGASLPVFRDTYISASASYSIRGTTDNGLQKEQILRISFSLDVSETWFQRSPEE